jgi:membrane protein
MNVPAERTAVQNKNSTGNIISRTITRINIFQQSHKPLAFTYAVVKKYGDDEAAYQGALITYYGFLSLFPLLIVATSLIEVISNNNDALRTRFVSSFNNYFPVIGQQLQTSVHGGSKSGLALLLGIIIALLGARGGVSAVQHALNHIWQVPRKQRAGFPKSLLINFKIMFVGGGGLLGAVVLSGLATNLGHSFLVKILSSVISIVVLFGVFTFIFYTGTDAKGTTYKDFILAAALSAVGFHALQLIGTYYIGHELSGLKSLYSTFAVVLGLLAWIYLQAQIMLYSLEAATVHSLKLWPRSMENDKLTDQDKLAYKLYAKKETYVGHEKVDVKL